jgi:hypothetical protein
MVHLRMKYFQKQKNMYLWGRGIALVKEDVLKMLEFFEEALLLCQVDKDETKKFLVLMADFIEYSREWTNSDAVDLADVVDDFFVNGATIKDLLSSKAKITEPYELYKAVNEVKAHKDTLMCILLTRLCNHTFATVEAKESGGYVEIYETDRIALKRTRRQQGESAAVLQRARADASEVFATMWIFPKSRDSASTARVPKTSLARKSLLWKTGSFALPLRERLPKKVLPLPTREKGEKRGKGRLPPLWLLL